jgi:hypothetical protein
MSIEHILIFPCHGSYFQYSSGGTTCSYEMAKYLSQYIDVLIYSSKETPNNIYNKTFSQNILSKDLNTTYNIENTLVIYGETVEDNPLGAKYIVRWILGPIGLVSNRNIFHTWNKYDLIYFFNNELKMNNKSKDIIKLLTSIHVNPNLQDMKLIRNGNGYCHTFRKSRFHKNIRCIHPNNSYMISGESQEQLIQIFNHFEIFISYDPLTFLNIMAALCGCISVVYKIDGLSKEEWIENTCISRYLKLKNETLYGVAYGYEEIEYAKQTIHLVKQQWMDFQSFMIEQTVVPFLNDIKNTDNISKLQNTVDNVYYS